MAEKDIWEILNRNLFFVKDGVKKLEAKSSDKLDVYDPESRQILLECREPDIGIITKIARLIGGRHDKGTAFNLVASLPNSKQQALRAARGNATLSFGGPAVLVSDHNDSLLGSLKKKNFALGTKFVFVPEGKGETFMLQLRENGEIYCNDKKAALISRWSSDFYKENEFKYAFHLDNDVPANSVIRQVLLAFALAKHRVVI